MLSPVAFDACAPTVRPRWLLLATALSLVGGCSTEQDSTTGAKETDSSSSAGSSEGGSDSTTRTTTPRSSASTDEVSSGTSRSESATEVAPSPSTSVPLDSSIAPEVSATSERLDSTEVHASSATTEPSTTTDVSSEVVSSEVSSSPVTATSVGSSGETSGGSSAPLTGQELYLATGCNGCHGDDAQGTALGPELRHPMDSHFEEIVANGPGTHVLEAYVGQSTMPAYGGTLSKSERDLIRDWLQSFPNPTTGAALFADYCAHCHGDDGLGGAKVSDGPPIVLSAYATPYHSAPFTHLDRAGEIAYVRAGHTGVAASDRRAYMPAFSTTVLSDNELNLLLDWVPQN